MLQRRCGRCVAGLQVHLVGLLASPGAAAPTAIARTSWATGDATTEFEKPVARTIHCPDGFYREGLVVFACGENEGEVYALLGDATIDVPAGLRNFGMVVETAGAMNMSIQDASNHSEILGTSGGNVHWRGASINYTRVSDFVVSVVIAGVLNSSLSVRMTSDLPTQSRATIMYRHNGFEQCPSVPIGCSKYDPVEVRQQVLNWSKWASSEFPSAAGAWEALCLAALESSGAGRLASPVPFYAWPEVETLWACGAAAAALAGLALCSPCLILGKRCQNQPHLDEVKYQPLSREEV